MKLYHGTNADIEKIDLEKGLRHKDFTLQNKLPNCFKTNILINSTILELNVHYAILKKLNVESV